MLYRYLRAAESIDMAYGIDIDKSIVHQSDFVCVAQRKGEFLVHSMDHWPARFSLLCSDGPGPFELPSRKYEDKGKG